MTAAVRRSFDSLSVPNYRRYFTGQLVSLSGNWMQIVAEVWLILSLTGSGLAVGLTTALQFLPILIFGALGGLLADRFSKRNLLLGTQLAMMVPVLALAAVTLAGVVAPWMVYALVFARGLVIAVDNPTRQAFVIEMVGPDRVVNAVSLNSVLVHGARIAGPAVAGIVIAIAGVGYCFLINATTFVAMLIALRLMVPAELRTAPPSGAGPGAIRAALRYVWATPALKLPLVLMALLGTVGLNFQVIVPLLARFTFQGDASAYAILLAAMGAGSIVGALVTGARNQTGSATITGAALAFGVLALLASAAPSLALEVPVMALLGAAAVTFAATINSLMQLAVEPAMRGRVMALYTVVVLGSNPIGAPLIGWISEAYAPRAALVVMAAAGLTVALLARIGFARIEVARPGANPKSSAVSPAESNLQVEG
ncbi:MAG TPA: MFS transporter [Solirubrobacterales bacterium]|nr:MFS transporter [Solirubrobacterales bacterium]